MFLHLRIPEPIRMRIFVATHSVLQRMFLLVWCLYLLQTDIMANQIIKKQYLFVRFTASWERIKNIFYVLVYNKYLTSQIGLCSLDDMDSILSSLISKVSIFAFVGSK